MPNPVYLDFVKRGKVSENEVMKITGPMDQDFDLAVRITMVAERLLVLTDFDLKLAKKILKDVYSDPNFRGKLD